MLQKFRKTISLHFSQRKSSKESYTSDDTASEAAPSEEESSPRHTGSAYSSGERYNVEKNGKERDYSNQKHR